MYFVKISLYGRYDGDPYKIIGGSFKTEHKAMEWAGQKIMPLLFQNKYHRNHDTPASYKTSLDVEIFEGAHSAPIYEEHFTVDIDLSEK